MGKIQKIDEQIQKERDFIAKMNAQINVSNIKIKNLKKERKIAEEEELDAYIDNWLNEKFNIRNQKAARRDMYIVFDAEANFIKTVTCGTGGDFHYISPAKIKGTMEHWLKNNKLYAHCAASFCCRRDYDWYQKSLKEQLENLCWEFDEDGKLCNTAW